MSEIENLIETPDNPIDKNVQQCLIDLYSKFRGELKLKVFTNNPNDRFDFILLMYEVPIAMVSMDRKYLVDEGIEIKNKSFRVALIEAFEKQIKINFKAILNKDYTSHIDINRIKELQKEGKDGD